MHWFDTGQLLINSSNFYFSLIKITGRFYQFSNSYFFNSDVYATDGSLLSTVSMCEFELSPLIDISTSSLSVNNSYFHGAAEGVEKWHGSLNLKCNEFNDLGCGVAGTAKARVNLSTIHGAGYNKFHGNVHNNIRLDLAAELSLENGYNELYETIQQAPMGYNISHSLSYPSISWCPPDINANLNVWTPHGSGGGAGYPNPQQFSLTAFVNSATPPLTCPQGLWFGTVAQVASCGEHDLPIRDPLAKSNAKSGSTSTMPLITSATYYDGHALDEAIEMASAATTWVDSANGDNLVSADMFYELLHADIDSGAVVSDSMYAAVKSLRWQALADYKTVIETMMTDSSISIQGNQQSFDPTLEKYVNTLMHLTDSVKTAANYMYQFELEVFKATLFRSLNKPELSYAILSNVDYCEHDSLEKAILTSLLGQLAYDISVKQLTLSELLASESAYTVDSVLLASILPGMIDTSAFGSYIVDPEYVWFSDCSYLGAAKKMHASTDPVAIIKVFPNPASFNLGLEFHTDSDLSDGIYDFRLLDLNGKLVMSTQINQSSQQLSLPKLPAALYLGVVHRNGMVIHQEKLHIIQ